MGIYRRVLRCTVREGDDNPTVARKSLMLTTAPGLAVGCFALGVSGLSRDPLSYTCCLFAASALGWFLLAALFVTRTMALQTVEAVLMGATLCVIVGDWGLASGVGLARIWSFSIILMDVTLSVGASPRTEGFCLHSTAVWLFISALEDGYRLGLYDIEGWTERYPSGTKVELADCADPPCAGGLHRVVSRAFLGLFSLYVDFMATRGFAIGQRKEQRRVGAMVGVAEQVATCLSHYDLDAAREALDTAGGDGLSEELGESFRVLLANLASYRPFLPQSCFEESAADSELDSVAEAAPTVALPSPVAGGPDSPTPRATEHDGIAAVQSVTSTSLPAPGTAEYYGSGKVLLQSPPNPARALSFDSVLSHSGHVAALVRTLSQGSDDPPAGRLRRKLSTPRLAHAAQRKRVTLLATNRRGMLAALPLGGSLGGILQMWIAARMSEFCISVASQKGVVDLLSGDHLYATFGALKFLGAHRVAAVRCAASLAAPQRGDTAILADSCRDMDLPFSSAVCTGVAIVGDFGLETVRRFMVVGGVTAFALVLERIAAGWGTEVLTDESVHEDCTMHWDFCLRMMVVFPKISPRPMGLWEKCEAKVRDVPRVATGNVEWMYELDAIPADPWDPYNAAVALWCRGDPDAALHLVKAVEADSEAGAPHNRQVSDALAALQADLSARDGSAPAAPPLVHVPIASGVGSGAPLRVRPPSAAPSGSDAVGIGLDSSSERNDHVRI